MLGKLDSHMQNKKLDHCLTPYTKMNSNWIKDLIVRPGIIKLLEDNIGSMLFHPSLSNIFIDMSPQAKETKAKINKWDYSKLNSSTQQRKHQ